MDADFRGRGLAFPVHPDGAGEVAMVEAGEDIREAILIILQTDPGERVMRPDFGAGLRRFLFEPITSATMAMVQHRVEQALIEWEPRIDVDQVTVTAPDAALGRLDIEVRYRVRSTNTFYNLVYPFYVREGAQ